jgi:hypothetical protein
MLISVEDCNYLIRSVQNLISETQNNPLRVKVLLKFKEGYPSLIFSDPRM